MTTPQNDNNPDQPLSSDLKSTTTEAMNQAYNLGVDHAIKIVEVYFGKLDELVSSIQKLKKP